MQTIQADQRSAPRSGTAAAKRPGPCSSSIMTQIGTRIVLPRRRATEAVQAESVKAKRTILTAGGIEVFEAERARMRTQGLAITVPITDQITISKGKEAP